MRPVRELATDAAQWRDRLHQAISAGTMVDLTDGVDVDITSDTPWPDTHHIPADAIRAALLNPPTNPDPTGLRIKGAWIDGKLDLNDATLTTALALHQCVVPDGLTAHRTRIPQLALTYSAAPTLTLTNTRIDTHLTLAGTTLTNQNGTALTLEQAHIGGNLYATDGLTTTGQVRANGATITGHLILNGATLTNKNRTALTLDQAHIGGGRDCCTDR